MGNITFDIPSSALAISSGTFLSKNWRIREYVAGVLIDTRMGTLNVGDPVASETFIGNVTATYRFDDQSFFSDGAMAILTVPVQKSGSILKKVLWNTPAFSISCRDAKIEIINLQVPADKSYQPQYFDGDANQIGLGLVFTGELPEPLSGIGALINIGFAVGLDVAQWTDLPSSIDTLQIAATGFYMVNCLQ